MKIIDYVKNQPKTLGLMIVWDNGIDHKKLASFVFYNLAIPLKYEFMCLNNYDGEIDPDYFINLIEDLNYWQGCQYYNKGDIDTFTLTGANTAHKIHRLFLESPTKDVNIAKSIILKINEAFPIQCAFIYDFVFEKYQSITSPIQMDISIDEKSYKNLIYTDDNGWDAIDISNNPGRATVVQYGVLMAAPYMYFSDDFINRFEIRSDFKNYIGAEKISRINNLWEIVLFENLFDSINKTKELQEFRKFMGYDLIEEKWKW